MPPRRGPLRFYTIGPWTTRKALAVTIAAYLEAFDSSDDVSLFIHTSEEDHVARHRVAARGWAVHPDEGNSSFALQAILDHRGKTPPIELHTDPLTNSEVRTLHETNHCFVSLSRGEGWGFAAFDAAAVGNPVVATGWGGTVEFLPDDYPYLVDYDLVRCAEDEWDNWAPLNQGWWAHARIPDAVEKLRSVYDHRGAAWNTAVKVAADIGTRFNSVTLTDRFLRALARVPDPR